MVIKERLDLTDSVPCKRFLCADTEKRMKKQLKNIW